MKTLTENASYYEVQQAAEDLSSCGIAFKYAMSAGEIEWAKFIAGKYTIYDYLCENSDEGWVVTFNDAEAVSRALDDDCKGAGKAVMLSDESTLQALFFYMYSEKQDE